MNHSNFTCPMVTAVWAAALVGLAVWFLLAWAGGALLSDSSDWLFARVDPLIASEAWDQRLQWLLAWAESLGTAAVWGVWALGSLGLLLAALFATLLHRRAQRAQPATG
jgi:hypothetical protein